MMEWGNEKDQVASVCSLTIFPVFTLFPRNTEPYGSREGLHTGCPRFGSYQQIHLHPCTFPRGLWHPSVKLYPGLWLRMCGTYFTVFDASGG